MSFQVICSHLCVRKPLLSQCLQYTDKTQCLLCSCHQYKAFTHFIWIAGPLCLANFAILSKPLWQVQLLFNLFSAFLLRSQPAFPIPFHITLFYSQGQTLRAPALLWQFFTIWRCALMWSDGLCCQTITSDVHHGFGGVTSGQARNLTVSFFL